VQGQPGFNSTFDTNDIDPALPHVNTIFPEEHILLLPNNNDNAAQKDPATLDDDTFIKNLLEYSYTCDEPIADVFDFPSLPEEALDIHLTNGQSRSPASSSLDNIHSEVSTDSVAQEETFNHVEAETMYMDVDDNIVPLPQLETFPNNLPTPVCAPFSIPANTDGSLVCGSFSVPVNTDGDIPLVVQVAHIPSRSQTVIMQGPALAARLSTTQAQCRPVMQTSVGSPRVKKVAKTNAERCELYRIKQKTKKKEGDEELKRLESKNRTLKAKEAALWNKVKRMKEAALRLGLGNYFNFDM